MGVIMVCDNCNKLILSTRDEEPDWYVGEGKCLCGECRDAEERCEEDDD